MSSSSLNCTFETTGFAPALILSVTQALWATQLICSLSPPDMWPKDYGKTAVENNGN